MDALAEVRQSSDMQMRREFRARAALLVKRWMDSLLSLPEPPKPSWTNEQLNDWLFWERP